MNSTLTPLLIASSNPGKLREIQAVLGDLPCRLLLPADLNLTLDVEESGLTYAENAALKAHAYWRATGLPCLADDSGLEVDALDGAPGLHSARYAPQPGANDADRRRLLLYNLTGRPRPWTARFLCTVAVADTTGRLHFSQGVCPGEIIPEERGNDGFGYDPIFQLNELSLTMAELTLAQKNTLSHRARALIAARPHLLDMLSAR